MLRSDVLTRATSRPRQSLVSTGLKGALLALVAAVSWIGVSRYGGNPYLFLSFDVSFLALVALALPRPRLYSYTFIAAMLFLAFWMKMMMYLVFDTAFLEPIGAFDGSPRSWDRALAYASTAAIGVCLARVVHLWLARRRDWLPESADFPGNPPPRWYAALRAPLWAGSLVLLFLLNAFNFQVAFYQTGVNPKLILPLHLNVVAAWLVNVGFALWFACLIHWDFAHAPKSLANALIAPVVEALLSSTSALSRSFYAMHTVSYYFALGEHWARVRAMLPGRARAGLVLFWVLGLALSLSLVSWLRIHIYYLGYTPTYFTVPEPEGNAGVRTDPTRIGGSVPSGSVPSVPGTDGTRIVTPVGSMIWKHGGGEITPGATVANQIRPMAQQVSNLFIARWIGLEGTLAVSAYEAKSPGFLLEALRESPTKGNDSVYQKIAKSSYEASEAFTFLTLPGFVAILAYSGSLLVVLIGAALAVLLVIVTEIAGSRLTGNPFLLSVAGLATANVLCQTNFPYLTAVFFVELWIALVFIWGLQALPWRTVRAGTARQR